MKSGPKPRAIAERFWEKVDRRGPKECWNWTAATSHGYGIIGSGGRQGVALKAHRVSWILANGMIPWNLCVLHDCDNRKCVNPKHLFLGTRADNNLDRVAKGRNPDPETTRHPGESNGRSILSGAGVLMIRRRYADGGITHAELAIEHGVCEATIQHAIVGRSWSHVAEYGRRFHQ
jgi:hypothetical protein